MAHSRLLRPHVRDVVPVRLQEDRNALDHVDPEALERRKLLGVVAEQADTDGAKVAKNVRAGDVVPRVSGEAERLVCLDGVESLLLERVGSYLVEQADAAAFLAQIHEHAGSVLRDRAKRCGELRPAVAPQGPEDVAGETLRVNSDERRLGALNVAEYEGDLFGTRVDRSVTDDAGAAVRRRELCLCDADDGRHVGSEPGGHGAVWRVLEFRHASSPTMISVLILEFNPRNRPTYSRRAASYAARALWNDRRRSLFGPRTPGAPGRFLSRCTLRSISCVSSPTSSAIGCALSTSS